MITEIAPAKINLALHVRRRRGDGYHELETLFAFVEHGDVVTLADGPPSLTITGPFAAGLSGEGNNLVTRAASVFAATFELPVEGKFTLDKQLPVASGIGGGSADAAAALRALARRHGVALDDPHLFACAEALGSDVPACLLGRTALGRGRGEVLEPIDGLRGMPVLLVNPGVAVSTAAVFKAWDGIDLGPIPEGDLLARTIAGRNDLEGSAAIVAPVITELLVRLATPTAPSPAQAGTQLLNKRDESPSSTIPPPQLVPGLRRGRTEKQGGPILSRMSGSGATCFALYETEAERAVAAAAIRNVHPEWWCLETRLV